MPAAVLALAASLILSSALPAADPSEAPPGVWSLIGPEGGRVMALSATPDLSRLHAAVLGGGVFHSVDGGRTWRPSDSGMAGVLDLQTLARDPAAAHTLWAGSPAHGVLRSRDGGRTWQPWNEGLEVRWGGASVKALRAVLTPEGTTLYAGSIEGQVWRRDAAGPAGDPWLPAGQPLGAPVFVLAADPREPARMWAGTAGGLFRSPDGGATWIAASHGLPSRFVKGVAPSPFTPGEVWAGTGAGAARSVDGGRSWQPLDPSSGLPAVEVRSFVFDPQSPHPGEARLWAGTGEGLFASTDGGVTWRSAAAGLPQLDVSALLALDGDATTLVAGLAGAGVAVSFPDLAGPPSAWELSNAGLTGTAVGSLAADPLEPGLLWAGATGLGVLARPPGSAPWIFPGGSPGPEPVLALAALAGGDPGSRVLLAALAGRGLRRSIDHGRTWHSPPGLPAGPLVDLEPVPGSGSGPGDPRTLLAALPGSGIYASDDLGASWEPRTDGLDDLGVRALAAALSSPGTVYAVTDRGGVFVSHDVGESWEDLGAGGLPSGLRALAVAPGDAARLYAGTAVAGVFESLDGGRSWSERNDGLNGGSGALAIRDLEVDGTGRGWVATAAGVFLALPDGEVWRRAGPGLPLDDVVAVLPDPVHSERVWAALNGRGVAVLESETRTSTELHPRRVLEDPGDR